MTLRRIFIALYGVALVSCNAQFSVVPTTYEDIEQMQCLGDAQHTFHYSIPIDYESKRPLIIAIDAKGRGEMAVKKLVAACAYTPAIIVGSDNIRNGQPDFEESIDDLINTAISTFNGNNSTNAIDEESIYLVGFSGGARIALGYANNNKIKGIVMIGAGPGADLPKFNVYVMGGNAGFNFIEMYRRPIIQMLDDGKHLFDYFQGGHQWPDSANLTDAMLFHLAFKSEIGQQIAEIRAEDLILNSEVLLNNGFGLRAWKNIEKSYKLTRKVEFQKEIRIKADEITKSNEFRMSISSTENYLRLEMTERQKYIDSSFSANSKYWRDEIVLLKDKFSFSSDSRMIEHSARMSGFLGIMFYSRIKSEMISKENLDLSKELIDAFEFLEPENSDMLYFKAQYFTELNEMDSASHYLALARKNGLVE